MVANEQPPTFFYSFLYFFIFLFMNKQTPSLLNHIYCNRYTNNVISGSVTYDISDHNPVFVLSPTNKMLQNNSPRCEIQNRNFSKFSEAKFLDCLKNNLDNSDFSRNFSDPNTEFFKFLNIFLNCLDTHVPIQKLSRRNTNFFLKPWLTKSIQI